MKKTNLSTMFLCKRSYDHFLVSLGLPLFANTFFHTNLSVSMDLLCKKWFLGMAKERASTPATTCAGHQVVPTKQSIANGLNVKPSKRHHEENDFDVNTFLAQHHDALQTYVLLNLRPQQIADRFHSEYGVPITQTEVSQQINNLKKNGRIRLNPVNESTHTRAEDSVYPPWRYCKSDFLELNFLFN